MSAPGPYLLDETDRRRAFWADTVADEIEARDPTDPVVVKGGVSPSGVPHIGHFNEIMRGYYVAEVLRERGHEVRQVFTADDRDRLRSVPRTLATLDGEIVDLDDERVDAGALGRNLGKPYTDIPDPFGCCDSYGEHFTELLARSAELVGVPVDVVSTTELYESGAFDDAIRHLLEHREEARSVLSSYQDKVDETYVPFQARCENCGRLTEGITSVGFGDGLGDDRTAAGAESDTEPGGESDTEPGGESDTESGGESDTEPGGEPGFVGYVCEDVEAGGQTIEGCGHRGTVGIRDGKLPWRFEWPAQWSVLGVDFEPFGKDHAEGSWPSGKAIAREVFGVEPPVPMAYEWFTLDGRPLSSSEGTVVTVHEVLELLEVEVFRYFFTKNPRKQRDFSIERVDRLVDEFDRFERLYFDQVESDDVVPGNTDTEREFARRVYPLVVGREEVRPGRVRIPYRFAAVLGMTDDVGLRESMARRSGHVPAEAPEWAVDDALDRVEKARTWARRTDNEYNYRIARDLPSSLDLEDSTREALADLAGFVERADPDGDELQGEMYETARHHGVDVGEFFEAGYRLFLDDSQGPRLGPFLAELDREFVVRRLRLEG